MKIPRVLASHIIFTTYGFWLPNDPRGSWSVFVRNWDIFLHGNATKVNTRASVAQSPHDHHRRLAAKTALRYPAVQFTGPQALCVAKGIAQAINESNYQVRACSILPKHVHIVVDRHDTASERIIGHFKARATQHLTAANLHPLIKHRTSDGALPSVWGRRGWRVYLNTATDITRAMEYVQRNPLKDGKPRQRWSFLV